MIKTQKIKLMIIENFIDHFTSNETERLQMKETAFQYVEEDHVDEVESYFNEIAKKAFSDGRLYEAGELKLNTKGRETAFEVWAENQSKL